MADVKADQREKRDPTVASDSWTADSDEGVQEAPAVEDADHAAVDKQYREHPAKPNKSTIAQIEVK